MSAVLHLECVAPPACSSCEVLHRSCGAIVCERNYPVGGGGAETRVPMPPSGVGAGGAPVALGADRAGAVGAVCLAGARCTQSAPWFFFFVVHVDNRQPTTDCLLYVTECDGVTNPPKDFFFSFIYRADPIGTSPPEPANPQSVTKIFFAYQRLALKCYGKACNFFRGVV